MFSILKQNIFLSYLGNMQLWMTNTALQYDLEATNVYKKNIEYGNFKDTIFTVFNIA